MYFVLELNTSKTNFFAYVINEWNKTDPNICSSSIYNIFRKALLKFTRPIEQKIFNISDPFGIKMLAILRLSFINLPEHTVR